LIGGGSGDNVAASDLSPPSGFVPKLPQCDKVDMRIPWVVRSAGVVLLSAVALGQVNQTSNDRTFLSHGVATAMSPRRYDTPIAPYIRPTLIGVYGPDGVFRKTSGPIRVIASEQPRLRPAEVPPWIDLGSVERVVEDYEPPAHATKAARGQSLLGTLRDRAAALAYGREAVLLAPTHITTDSRQRLIISDPEIPAVHVLDAAGKNSFRIVGGAQHRLREPNGVAVDAAGNIYVADRKRGMILVYDPDGNFLRYIGNFRGESLFAAPTGIAIDRNAGHIYALDSPMNELVVLDLEGNILTRVGNGRGTSIRFVQPTEIALGNDELAVLDGPGMRIQVFDLKCNLLRSFSIANPVGVPVLREIGLSVDRSSNIYVSNLNGSQVSIYDRDGHPIGGGIGSPFERAGFNGPGGTWIDSDRIYIADTRNSRVQVFLAPVTSDRADAAFGVHRPGIQ
jgi:DNA-binding beta-propeller fold protein YncE